ALNPMRMQLGRVPVRATGLLCQSTDARRLIAPPPLVAGLTADTKRATDNGKRDVRQGNLLTKLLLLCRREMIAYGHAHTACVSDVLSLNCQRCLGFMPDGIPLKGFKGGGGRFNGFR